jgi:hypothetical protein
MSPIYGGDFSTPANFMTTMPRTCGEFMQRIR